MEYQFNRFIEKPKISDLSVSSTIYELLKVNPEVDDNLRILDQMEDDNLLLIHYLKPEPQVKHIRGVVIDTERKCIVAESFPYTEEYLASSEEAKKIPLDESCEVTRAHEGTILRAFCGNKTGNWYLSTHRKIDGRRSRWSGPPFGEMFNEVWEDATPGDYLSSKNCYVFLLSHQDNRLVCEISKPCIHHVQTFVPGENGQMVPTFDSLLKPHPQVQSQVILQVNSTEELVKMASELDERSYSGLLITRYCTSSKARRIVNCWKIVPEEYENKRKIRGNEPNFRLRYLQLLKQKKEDQIRELFPEKKDLFDKVDLQLKELPKFATELYQERYFKSHFVYLSREFHFILESTRRAYDPKLSLEKNLENTILLSNALQLNAMIRYMLQEQKD